MPVFVHVHASVLCMCLCLCLCMCAYLPARFDFGSSCRPSRWCRRSFAHRHTQSTFMLTQKRTLTLIREGHRLAFNKIVKLPRTFTATHPYPISYTYTHTHTGTVPGRGHQEVSSRISFGFSSSFVRCRLGGSALRG